QGILQRALRQVRVALGPQGLDQLVLADPAGHGTQQAEQGVGKVGGGIGVEGHGGSETGGVTGSLAQADCRAGETASLRVKCASFFPTAGIRHASWVRCPSTRTNCRSACADWSAKRSPTST